MKNSVNSDPKETAGLSAEARRWWANIRKEYEITDAGGLAIITAAAEAFDMARKAQDLVLKEGMALPDRFWQMKPHPAVMIELNARSQMLAALKQLHLDVEPLKSSAGRPAGSK
jgi:phage terminase small subunit